MVKLTEMTREELLEVISIKDEVIHELREEIKQYQQLISELRGEQKE